MSYSIDVSYAPSYFTNNLSDCSSQKTGEIIEGVYGDLLHEFKVFKNANGEELIEYIEEEQTSNGNNTTYIIGLKSSRKNKPKILTSFNEVCRGEAKYDEEKEKWVRVSDGAIVPEEKYDSNGRFIKTEEYLNFVMSDPELIDSVNFMIEEKYDEALELEKGKKIGQSIFTDFYEAEDYVKYLKDKKLKDKNNLIGKMEKIKKYCKTE